jgi:hypothetical protein
VAGELEELVYGLAQQALAEQDSTFDELRTRTGTLLAASSLVASFLGARAIDDTGFSWALFWGFRGACIALLGEVVFWAIALGLH